MSFYEHGNYQAQVREVEGTQSPIQELRQQHKHCSYL